MAQATFSIATGDDDGEAEGVDTTYPVPAADTSDTTTTYVDVGRSFSTPNYTTGVALLRWDTSTLPDDATVTGATLRVYIVANNSTDGLNVNLEWYEPGTINTGDWTNTASTTAHSATTINSMTNPASKDFTLTNAAANVNLSGYTGLRCHVSAATPTGDNYYAFEAYDGTNPEPQLIVDYTTPAVDILRTVRSSLRW